MIVRAIGGVTMTDDESGSTSPAGPAPRPNSDPGRAPTIGVAGFVLAITGLFLPPFGLVGLVLAALGLAEAKRSNLPSRLCLVGVILGTIACIEGLSLIVVWVLTP
jgi:hypothetical protein